MAIKSFSMEREIETDWKDIRFQFESNWLKSIRQIAAIWKQKRLKQLCDQIIAE